MAEWLGLLCVLDFKWGGAETMGMKKTWQGCEKQPTSITLEGTVPKMVHAEVDVHFREKYSPLMCLNDTITILKVRMHCRGGPGRSVGFSSVQIKGLRCALFDHSGFNRVGSPRDFCDIYKPVKPKYGVFEEAKGSACATLMPNWSH